MKTSKILLSFSERLHRILCATTVFNDNKQLDEKIPPSFFFAVLLFLLLMHLKKITKLFCGAGFIFVAVVLPLPRRLL